MEEIILLQDYKRKFYMTPKITAKNIWKTVLKNNAAGVTYKLISEPDSGAVLITCEKTGEKMEYYVRDGRIATQQDRNKVLEDGQKREKQKRMKAMLGAGAVAAGLIAKEMITGSHSSPVLAGHSVEKTYDSLLSENDVASGLVVSEFLYNGGNVSYAHYHYPLIYLKSKFNNDVVKKGVPDQFYLPVEKNCCVTIERTDVFDFHVFEFGSEIEADVVLDKITYLMS